MTEALSLEAFTATGFEHRQSAHCESGVMANLLSHYGLAMSEPMAFGLANAMSFAYLPFIKLSGLPLIAYRMPPRWIIKRLQKATGVRMRFRNFRDPTAGMQALDALLEQGRLVGLQTSVFWLPYFPEEMRFHFNAHNLLVYGRDGDQYQLSDPIFEDVVDCPRADLQKARFAKGALAAKGLLYYPDYVPGELDYPLAIVRAVRANYRTMAAAPLPIVGVRGIRYLGRKLRKMAANPAVEHRYLGLYLNHIVRMQEEIGTGGAGFRFLYGAFLNEAAQHCHRDLLQEASAKMTAAGDQWREFALAASQMSRQREAVDGAGLEHLIGQCADREAAVWELLRKL